MRYGVLAIALVLLAACGGGGGGGGDSGGGSGSGGGVAPGPTAALTENEAARLLTQASFGPNDASIAVARGTGANGWITQQLAAPLQPQSHVAYLDARLAELRQDNPDFQLNANQFYESWWKDSITANDQLRQRMKFALSQIFVVSLQDGALRVRSVGSYYDTLGANAFGNYRTLLEQVTLHPAMGIYLTYLANQRESGTRTPDENYAREVMQLMSIGLVELNPDGTERRDAQGRAIPTYDPDDISGLAKVFTGLSWYSPSPTATTFFGGNADPDRDIRPMIAYPQYHSISEKRFLNVTIPASTTPDVAGDLKIALDALAAHPNVGPFMCQRLIQQLVTSNPSPDYVRRCSTTWGNNGAGVRGDLSAVLRTILTDAEARTAASGPDDGKLREPVIRLTNWARAFEATSQSGDFLITSTSSNQILGQSPLASPSVFNFWRPGFTPPATTELGQRSLLAPEFQAVDEVSVAGYVNTMSSWVTSGYGSTPRGGTGRDVNTTYAKETAIADNAAALADRLNKLLFYGQMSAATRDRIIAAINSTTVPANGTTAQIDAARLARVRNAVTLAMASPDYLVQR